MQPQADSNLDFLAGQTIPNTVLVKIGTAATSVRSAPRQPS